MESVVLLMTVGIILIAAKYGDTQLCNGMSEEHHGDVRFCMNSQYTGKTIFITSGAPKYANASCVCDIRANVQSNAISASYMLLHKDRNCGIKIEISDSDKEFSCDDAEANLPSNVTRLYLHITDNMVADKIGAGMCLRINIERDTNATVTILCRSPSPQFKTLSVPLSVTTDSMLLQTRQSSLQSLPADSSPMVSTTNSITATQTTVTVPNSHENKTTLSQSQDIGSNTDTQTVVISALGGVCGVLFLVLTAVLLFFCHRKRWQSSKPDQSTDHVYVNADRQTSGKVNEIALYDGSLQDNVYETAASYDTVDNDGGRKSVKKVMPVLYNNVKTDDDIAPYNTLNVGKEHYIEHIYKSLDTKTTA